MSNGRADDGERPAGTGLPFAARCLLLAAIAALQLWLAHRYFGFLTGDELEREALEPIRFDDVAGGVDEFLAGGLPPTGYPRRELERIGNWHA